MQGRAEKYNVGDMRPSQLLHTFGIGAVIDLPNLSVMVMGLDDWVPTNRDEIGEERLLVAVQQELGDQVKRLLAPPRPVVNGIDNPFDNTGLVGVPVAAFPRWMLCPSCRLLAPLDSGLFQFKHDAYRQDRARYVHANCSKAGAPPTVLPARFLIACERGHLDDFPWNFFVHGDLGACQGPLRLLEQGVSGEAADVYVHCDACKTSRPMSQAFGDEGKQSLPCCRGRHPHLRDFDEEPCPERTKAILLGASNSWFGITLTALSVPVAVDRLGQLVDAHWHILEKTASQQNIELLQQLGHLPQFNGYTANEVWQAAERKRNGGTTDTVPRSLKAPEWQVLTNPASASAMQDFQTREVAAPATYRDLIERVVLVERLREVSALVGFTRITSPNDFTEVGELPPELCAPLSRRSPQWIPASEVHGEGIFLQFSESWIASWLYKDEIRTHNTLFAQAHQRWRRERHLDPSIGYPGLRYVLLHSFSHALMRQFALECGYAMASIRERIYALPPTDEDGPMAGILLYTAAPDSEGTLGGLVSLGQPTELDRHITAALEQMRLCASDPLCAEHAPLMDDHVLHGAACHACLFAPETSCERGNRYLDRSLLVATLERSTLAFFDTVYASR